MTCSGFESRSFSFSKKVILSQYCISVKSHFEVEPHPVGFRYLYCQTTTQMTIISQKHQILESLEALDHVQTEKVLDYIKGLLYPSRDNAQHRKLKREAIKEIRQALGKGRKLKPSF